MDEDPSKYEFEGSSHWMVKFRPISRGLRRMLTAAARLAFPRCRILKPPQPFFAAGPPACSPPDLPRIWLSLSVLNLALRLGKSCLLACTPTRKGNSKKIQTIFSCNNSCVSALFPRHMRNRLSP